MGHLKVGQKYIGKLNNEHKNKILEITEQMLDSDNNDRLPYFIHYFGYELMLEELTVKNNTMETIICSAIWYKELELKRPDVLEPRGYRPYNVDKGIVFSGWRHHNCLYQMVAITGLPDCKAGESIEGFLTNKNRFVDRIEGAEIALACKQITELKFSSRRLFSEDLY